MEQGSPPSQKFIFDSERRAQLLVERITEILAANSKSKLSKWQASTATRGGAARWIKQKLAALVAATQDQSIPSDGDAEFRLDAGLSNIP